MHYNPVFGIKQLKKTYTKHGSLGGKITWPGRGEVKDFWREKHNNYRRENKTDFSGKNTKTIGGKNTKTIGGKNTVVKLA
jgi:hypothetical protein